MNGAPGVWHCQRCPQLRPACRLWWFHNLQVDDPQLNGATFGAYYDGQRFAVINFGIDVRGTVMPVKDTMGVTLVTAGPRAVFHLPLVPLRPYGEGLVGGGKVQYGSGGMGTYNQQ